MEKETIKSLIKIYTIRGMKNTEIADKIGISERTVYRYLKTIREEENTKYGEELDRYHEKLKPKENIMSPHNPCWKVFYNIMCVRLDSHPCDARTLKQSRFVLKEFFPEIDMEKSLDYFRSHGGYCDCEVMMNVEDSSDNIKYNEEEI